MDVRRAGPAHPVGLGQHLVSALVPRLGATRKRAAGKHKVFATYAVYAGLPTTFNRGPNFGKGLTNAHFAIPRTFQYSAGFRS